MALMMTGKKLDKGGDHMGASIIEQDGNLRVLRVTGLVKKSELDAVQTAIVNQPEHIRLLVIAEGFQGWERGADWGDISFFSTYGDLIDKIAIVAPARWETDLMTFAMTGLRRAPVQFFSEAQLAQARAWVRA
jgi:hypothetical protein